MLPLCFGAAVDDDVCAIYAARQILHTFTGRHPGV